MNTQASAAIQMMKDDNYMVNGPRLFNSLPRHIRDLENCSLNCFKNELDRYLDNIPDQPRVTGYTNQTESNSLLSMNTNNVVF